MNQAFARLVRPITATLSRTKLGVAVLSAMTASAQGEVPTILVVALIAGEDHRFLRHCGVDVFATGRAFVACLRGRIQGASTIEQQLIRTLMGDRRRTIRRKIRDCLGALVLAANFEKRCISSAYLNSAYFGWSCHGYRSAAVRLGIDPDRMSVEEAATIVALLKRPITRPRSADHLLKVARRSAWIRSRMSRPESALDENGAIAAVQARASRERYVELDRQ